MIPETRWKTSISKISISLFLFVTFNFTLGNSGPLDQRTQDEKSPQKSYTALVVFGDSYSDNGHLRTPEFQHSLSDPPSLGGRYCDGFVWNEFLARKMKTERNITLLNYAYNGAHINSSLSSNPPPKAVPDTGAQINTYVNDVTEYLRESPEPQSSISRILHVIWIGINPILYHWLRISIDQDSEFSHEETMKTIQPNLDLEVESLIRQVVELTQSSSRLRNLNFEPHYLILNVPPLHGTLFVQKLSERLSSSDVRTTSRYLGIIESMTDYFNEHLLEGIETLIKDDDGPKVEIFDSMNFWNEVKLTPHKYGLSHLSACYPVTSQPPCSKPADYEYWDSLHPTTSVHYHLSEEIFQFIQNSGT